MKPVISILILLAAMVLVGCGSGSSADTDPSMRTNRLFDTAWELTLIQTASRERVPVREPGEFRIAFVEEARGVVQVGSNVCVMHYNSTGRALTLRLDCPSASLPPGSAGREFLAVLNSATQFGMTSNGQEMYIDGAGGTGGSLSFRRLSIEEVKEIVEQNQEG